MLELVRRTAGEEEQEQATSTCSNCIVASGDGCQGNRTCVGGLWYMYNWVRLSMRGGLRWKGRVCSKYTVTEVLEREKGRGEGEGERRKGRVVDTVLD